MARRYCKKKQDVRKKAGWKLQRVTMASRREETEKRARRKMRENEREKGESETGT